MRFLYFLAVDIFESAFYILRIIPFPSIIFFSTLLSFLYDFPCNMHSQFYFLSFGLWLAPQKALWLKNTKWEVVFSGFVNLLFSFSIQYIFRYLFSQILNILVYFSKILWKIVVLSTFVSIPTWTAESTMAVVSTLRIDFKNQYHQWVHIIEILYFCATKCDAFCLFIPSFQNLINVDILIQHFIINGSQFPLSDVTNVNKPHHTD